MPIFNTKAVARETDVPADTFRAWERRYGIPRPQRTPGGHRLYSERDIAIIRWLRDRTAEGMNISQAVILLNSALPEEGAVPAALPVLPSLEPRTLQRLFDELMLALIMFDGGRADHLLAEAFALYPMEDVLLDLVQPTLIEIGERWHLGEIGVATEHFATQFVRRKLSGLLNLFAGDVSRGTILIACAPGELHDLGALLVALFLVRHGWHVVYLGSQLPMADLIEAIRTIRPVLVCLSATMPETARQLAEESRTIHELFPDLQIGYGGRPFNMSTDLISTTPGIMLGQDARDVVDTVTTLLSRHGSGSEP